MKTKLKHIFLVSICIFLTGCATYIKPEKFDIDSQLLKSFKGNEPIQVLVPENADGKFPVENASGFMSGDFTEVYVDLNDLYRNTRELINEVLAIHHVPLSPNANKFLKFTITKVQWDKWAYGPMRDAYLEFDIETGDAYKKHYRVQDQSFGDVGRAVGGTTSRAVEQIFQDEKIISYIESQ